MYASNPLNKEHIIERSFPWIMEMMKKEQTTTINYRSFRKMS